jgi:hypothetical protein
MFPRWTSVGPSRKQKIINKKIGSQKMKNAKGPTKRKINIYDVRNIVLRRIEKVRKQHKKPNYGNIIKYLAKHTTFSAECLKKSIEGCAGISEKIIEESSASIR